MALFGGSEAKQSSEQSPQNLADLYGSTGLNLGKKSSVKGDLIVTDQGAMAAAMELAQQSIAAVRAQSGGPSNAALNSILLYGSVALVAVLAFTWLRADMEFFSRTVPAGTGITAATLGKSDVEQIAPRSGGTDFPTTLWMVAGGPMGLQVNGEMTILAEDDNSYTFPDGIRSLQWSNTRDTFGGSPIRYALGYSGEFVLPNGRERRPDVISANADIVLAAGATTAGVAPYLPNPSFIEYILCAFQTNAGLVRVSSYTAGSGTTDRSSLGRGFALYPGQTIRMPGNCGIQIYNESGAAATISLMVSRMRVLQAFAT